MISDSVLAGGLRAPQNEDELSDSLSDFVDDESMMEIDEACSNRNRGGISMENHISIHSINADKTIQSNRSGGAKNPNPRTISIE